MFAHLHKGKSKHFDSAVVWNSRQPTTVWIIVTKRMGKHTVIHLMDWLLCENEWEKNNKSKWMNILLNVKEAIEEELWLHLHRVKNLQN